MNPVGQDLNPGQKEVIDQALENCRFWKSTMCKRSTLEKYCREERDIEDPGKVIDELIERDVLYTPKPGYVGFKEPEKWGLESEESGGERIKRKRNYSSVSLPLRLLEEVDCLIKDREFWPSRSAFVREAVLEKIRIERGFEEHLKRRGKK